MKLGIPNNHPIAEAIREAAKDWSGQLTLSLDHFDRSGVSRIFTLCIDSYATSPTLMELELTNLVERIQQIEAMTKWPDLPTDTH